MRANDLAQQTLSNYQAALKKRDNLQTKIAVAPTPPPVPSSKPSLPEGSQGTCFAVSANGLLVTNNHVIEGMSEIQVTFGDNTKPINATVVDVSSATDLAVLKVSKNLDSYLPIAHSSSAKTGAKVFTMGFPVAGLLGSEPKYTEGVISSKTGMVDEAAFMQITVPIQPGNSGGPLVNFKGEVVGVTTSTAAVEPFFKKTGGAIPQSVNYAIKSEYITILSDEIDYRNGYSNDQRETSISDVTSALCFVQASM